MPNGYGAYQTQPQLQSTIAVNKLSTNCSQRFAIPSITFAFPLNESQDS